MPVLWNISLIGGVMILVIVGLRALLQNHLHRTVFLLLWLLVALRLAIPVLGASPFSVYNFLPRSESVSTALSDEETPILSERPQTQEQTAPMTEPVQSVATVTPKISMDRLLTIIWAMGCGVCFLTFTMIHIRSRLRYRFAVPEEGPEFLSPVTLKRSDEVTTPLVYGFFRPVILLPYDFPKKDSPEYEQVLHHELTHVHSGDLWYKLAILLITCVHWFNPLVWLMLRLSTQDMEIRCDARVIRKLGKKKTYALTLVQAEVQRSSHMAEAAFAFSLTELRLRSIVKTKTSLPGSIALFTLIAAVLLCCFATGPRALIPAVDASSMEEISVTESVPVFATEETETSATEGVTGGQAGLTPTEMRAVTDPTERFGDMEEEQAPSTYAQGAPTEPYGTELRVSLKGGDYQTFRFALPEQATCEFKAEIGEQGNPCVEMDTWYDAEEGYRYITLCGKSTGSAEVLFYIDGVQWCKIRATVGYRASGDSGADHAVDLTFDDSTLEHMEFQFGAPVDGWSFAP